MLLKTYPTKDDLPEIRVCYKSITSIKSFIPSIIDTTTVTKNKGIFGKPAPKLPSMIIDQSLKNLTSSEFEEKMREFSNLKTTNLQQQSHCNQIILKLTEYNFANARFDKSVVNLESHSVIGDMNFDSSSPDSLVQPIKELIHSEIKPLAEQLDQMSTGIDSLRKEQKLNQQDNMQNLEKLSLKLDKIGRSKNVKPFKMKEIIDQLLHLLNKIKCELAAVGQKISSVIVQMKSSKLTEKQTPEPSNLLQIELFTQNIESQTSSLIDYINQLPGGSPRNQKYISKLEKIKKFIIVNLPKIDYTNFHNQNQLQLEQLIDLEGMNYKEKFFQIAQKLRVETKEDEIDQNFYRNILIRLSDLLANVKLDNYMPE